MPIFDIKISRKFKYGHSKHFRKLIHVDKSQQSEAEVTYCLLNYFGIIDHELRKWSFTGNTPFRIIYCDDPKVHGNVRSEGRNIICSFFYGGDDLRAFAKRLSDLEVEQAIENIACQIIDRCRLSEQFFATIANNLVENKKIDLDT